jgi:hypothetical protein
MGNPVFLMINSNLSISAYAVPLHAFANLVFSSVAATALPGDSLVSTMADPA